MGPDVYAPVVWIESYLENRLWIKQKLGSSYRDPSFCLVGNLAFYLRHIDLSRQIIFRLAENLCRIIGNLIGNIHLCATCATMMLTEQIVLQIFV